jgi:tetratricopeptide (TPR) repeat protein
MTPVFWVVISIIADFWLMLNPLMASTSLSAFFEVLLMHMLVCMVVASAIQLLLPIHYRQPKRFVWLLLFCFSYIAPVLGAVALLLMTRYSLRLSDETESYAIPESVGLPEYDIQFKEGQRGSQGAIRSRLRTDVPGDVRMQSLLTLQAVPNKVSNPILEDLLGDSTDDVRLVAFGMLDAEEKKISKKIRAETTILEHALSIEQRYDCLRHLAELNWELVYASLAQGELRRHILGQARHYADAALALGVTQDSGLAFLKGRILLEQGEIIAAEAAINQAIALGQSITSALPYLAEMAFLRRDFVAVKQLMQQVSKLNLASRTRAIEDYWVKRYNEINFSDRRYLPHI